MYVLMHCPQAYKKVADADRKGFLQNYARHGIEDLKWVAYYSKKSESVEKEEDSSIRGMMTLRLA